MLSSYVTTSATATKEMIVFVNWQKNTIKKSMSSLRLQERQRFFAYDVREIVPRMPITVHFSFSVGWQYVVKVSVNIEEHFLIILGHSSSFDCGL